MKLYNIYQNIILEEISKKQLLLNEGVLEDIKAAMEQTYNIWFKYRMPDGTVTDRYVQLDKLGTSLANNMVVRLWQIGGKTTKSKKNGTVYGWKLFRLDRIVPNSIKPTQMTYNKPISALSSYDGPAYNRSGDKLMKGGITIANYK